MTDPIADMLTRVRNANTAFHDDVVMPSSKLKEAVAQILQREGYISGYEVGDRPGRQPPADEQAGECSRRVEGQIAEALVVDCRLLASVEPVGGHPGSLAPNRDVRGRRRAPNSLG